MTRSFLVVVSALTLALAGANGLDVHPIQSAHASAGHAPQPAARVARVRPAVRLSDSVVRPGDSLRITVTGLPRRARGNLRFGGRVRRVHSDRRGRLRHTLRVPAKASGRLRGVLRVGRVRVRFSVVVRRSRVQTGTPVSTTPTTPPTTTPPTTPPAPPPPPAGGHVLAAAGDFCSDSSSATCQQTASTVANLAPERLIGLGDYQYQNAGTAGATFQARYQQFLSALHGITIPAFGSTHDTCDGSGVWECYPVSFFNANGAPEVRGRLSDHQWGYSVAIGAWRVVVFNYRTGSGEGGSVAQLSADLDANPSQCLLAVTHAPVIGSPSSEHPTNEAAAFRQTLVDHGVDLVLNGHQHFYERNVDPAGFTAITAGEGGIGHYGRTSVASTAQAFDSSSFGVVKLTLGTSGWSTEFVKNAVAAAFADTASGSCG